MNEVQWIKAVAAVICIMVIGCVKSGGRGHDRNDQIAASHDSFFDSYFARIHASLRAEGFNSVLEVPVSFGDLPDAAILARCFHDGGPHGRIVFNKDLERKIRLLDSKGKTAMVDQALLHELGHCYFNRRHEKTLVLKPADVKIIDATSSGYMGRKGLVKAFIPSSLMYPFHIDDAIFQRARGIYLKELIEPGYRQGDEVEEKVQDCAGRSEKACVIGAVGDMVVFEIRNDSGLLLLQTTNKYEFESKMKDDLAAWKAGGI